MQTLINFTNQTYDTGRLKITYDETYSHVVSAVQQYRACSW
ncbi:hypothetical protein XNA1_2560011 [Xenorhabdus nematophila str. Anatoliense]|nr:hypothetical protein XNA1_2560011 [Xenorhabdus nematophila str. Anatoliense]